MIYYYGTALDSKGHDFYTLDGGFKNFPFHKVEFFKTDFNPECIADDKPEILGKVYYFRVKKWTICYIVGSCSDTRGGSKSVFFTDEEIRFGEFALKLNTVPIVRKIINQIPFKVNWSLNEEYTKKLEQLLNEK